MSNQVENLGVNVYVNLSGHKGEFLGWYENANEARGELAENREDGDYSVDTFRELYIVEFKEMVDLYEYPVDAYTK